MIYEIQTKNDLSGAMLVVRFPEEDLDRKALYTLQADQPDFLLPFRYRSVDGQAECVYQLGDCSKLQYRFGRRSTQEGVELWEKLLQPLLECNDWFLKPFSFVLDVRYIYINKDGKKISYVYIPSMKDCVDFNDLKSMVSELAQQNPVADPNLENKILRAIMQDFQPKTFLKMLREFKNSSAAAPVASKSQPVCEAAAHIEMPVSLKISKMQTDAAVPKEKGIQQTSESDDIVINLDGGTEKKEKKSKGKGIFGWMEKPDAAKEQKGGLFGKKEKKQKDQKEIILGAAEHVSMPEELNPNRVSQVAPVWTPPVEETDATQLDEIYNRTCLRLVGDPSLPREIPVEIEVGRAFTIGRFDVSVGHAQSDFEFDKKTKAVSRRHAAIEREMDGSYIIVDLSSSAGTFVNGQRLTANVPCKIERGCRISFGTSNADYIWEEG